jgi:16S rRNA (adenine1518-N6/adenine1519-N6)-dimethyltransferase
MTSSRPPRPTALHRYGQNHLVDANTLASIVRMAAVRPDDVVLEVGAAAGALTEQLASRARVVHGFEIDRRFRPRLEQLASRHENLRLHWGDALKADLSRLDPAPTALVANLAYSIAIPLIMRSIVELPGVERWAVMVQKELGERLFAVPSTKAYSAVSVLLQLACRKEGVRPVPRTVFSPQPRVDSWFVTFGRRTDGPAVDPVAYTSLERLVRVAFGQRRKMIINSLSGAAHGGRALTRDDVRRALDALGLPLTTRPEELAPDRFVALAREVGWL